MTISCITFEYKSIKMAFNPKQLVLVKTDELKLKVYTSCLIYTLLWHSLLHLT